MYLNEHLPLTCKLKHGNVSSGTLLLIVVLCNFARYFPWSGSFQNGMEFNGRVWKEPRGFIKILELVRVSIWNLVRVMPPFVHV